MHCMTMAENAQHLCSNAVEIQGGVSGHVRQDDYYIVKCVSGVCYV